MNLKKITERIHFRKLAVIAAAAMALLAGTSARVPAEETGPVGKAAGVIAEVFGGDFSGIAAAEENTVTNILLIGQDARPGETRARSDSMVLCSVDTGKNRITMISFMRDMYVAIPGYGSNRINSAYAWGGAELLDQTIEQNFGIHVDHNIEARFETFKELVNAFGGVDIELTEAEARHMKLEPGLNHLSGDKALAYSRIRKIDSDFERTGRQRKVLRAMYEKYLTMDLQSQISFVKTALDTLETDMTPVQVLGFAVSLLDGGLDLNVNSYRVPADGTYSDQNVSGMAVLVPDYEANKALIQQWIQE